eukprot:gene21773-27838_t
MIRCLESWLPIAINKLLYGAKCEADGFLQQVRLKIELVGRTVLIRQAQVSANNTNLDIIASNNSGHHRNKNSNSMEDQSTMLSHKSSISVKYIRSNGTVFGLSKWARPEEFDPLVPQHFLANTTADGAELVDNSLCEVGPLHKVLHLYAILGNLNSYHEHYRSTREALFTTILKTAERGANEHGLAAAIPRYFENLVGFFTVECVHRRSVEVSDGVFSYSELSALWDRACNHINNLCFNLAITLTSPDVLINIKEELLLLIDVVADESFGFKVAGLLDVMKNLWEVFEGLQMDSIVRACTDALDQCAYQPFYVTSLEVFNKQVRAFRLDSIELNDEAQFTRTTDSRVKSLDRERQSVLMGNAAANLDALEEEIGLSMHSPGLLMANSSGRDGMDRTYSNAGSSFMATTFPFSGVVPLLLRHFHLLIVRYFVFAVKNQHLGSRGEEICNAVVAAYQTISNSLRHELSKDGAETPLSKACQISIDAGTLSLASEAIWLMVENALKQFRWTEKIDVYISKAIDKSIGYLRNVVTQAQDLIFELLSNKIEDLLGSLVFINFEPDSLPGGPHEAVEEIVDFLQITFMCLTHLPQSVREAAHFTCCSRIASGIMSYILSDKVKHINALCILAFDYDARRLIQFSDSCGIPHLKQCFEEFTELVRAVLHPDLPQLGDSAVIRNRLCSRISAAKLATLLEKTTPTPLAATSHNLPRLEKAMIKALVKKLRLVPH